MEGSTNVENQDAMRFFYDQIELQPIEFKFLSNKVNKVFFAGVSLNNNIFD
jgi:hypothetical protein